MDDDRVDDHVDDEICGYLTSEPPKSFFLFAGAGSGKTRSLVTAIERVLQKLGSRMALHGRQVGVITYTNAACDEIKRRLEFHPLVYVSTIHSFVWELVRGFDTDVREWLYSNLTDEICTLQGQLAKGRAGTKIAGERQRSIETKQRRLAALPSIKHFTYSPTGDKLGRDSLSHAEVINLGAFFINDKPLMGQLLVARFPILLIDESQDTHHSLVDAFVTLQAAHREHFALGLFGDIMQRIYSDGKADLGVNLPADWAKPAKVMNHRCSHRIVTLINNIRASADRQTQQSRSDANKGCVRLFLVQSGATNQPEIESRVRRKMAEMAADPLWNDQVEVKALILEHLMAARRMQFWEMYESLHKVDTFNTGLRNGTLPFVRWFSEVVLPLVKAQLVQDEFATAAVVRKWSPLVSKEALEAAGTDAMDRLAAARAAVTKLIGLFGDGVEPRFQDVLSCIAQTGLLEIPVALEPFASTEKQARSDLKSNSVAANDEKASEFEGLRTFLEAPFLQIEPYAEYVAGVAPFGTHQGVKGLEYPRVLVIMDDHGAGGFLFSYEKLLGAEAKTKTDLDKEKSGEETAVERTRRLFYVTCSRSRQSLALLAYSSDPAAVKTLAISQGWFSEEEIGHVE